MNPRRNEQIPRSRALHDLIVIGFLGGVGITLSLVYEIPELYDAWFHDQTGVLALLHLDDLLIVVASLSVALAVFSFRRWKEARLELEQRRQTEEALRESEERFKQMADSIRHVFWLYDALSGRIIYVSPAYTKIWGTSREKLYQDPLSYLEQIHPEDRERIAAAQQGDFQSTFELEYRIIRPDGTVRWINTEAIPIRNEKGEVYRLAGVSEDVTDRKLADAEQTRLLEKLHRRNEEIARLSRIAEMLQASLDEAEAGQVIRQIAEGLFPRTAGAVYIVSPSRDVLEPMISWGEFPGKENPVASTDCWALRRGRSYSYAPDAGSDIPCSHIGQPSLLGKAVCVPLVAHGELLGLLHLRQRQGDDSGDAVEETLQLAVAVSEQIGLALANLRLRETLRHQSIRDPLTGLYNRRYMEEWLPREIARAARAERMIGLMMLDLDNFKRFNDTHGHAAGDDLLRAFAGSLESLIRGGDIACRYGGEEFVVILPEASLEHTQKRAQEILEKVRLLRIEHRGVQLESVSVSIGVAAYPLHGNSLEDLLKSADQALYQAKSLGRDRVAAAQEGDR